jgi:hypothetical protein
MTLKPGVVQLNNMVSISDILFGTPIFPNDINEAELEELLSKPVSSLFVNNKLQTYPITRSSEPLSVLINLFTFQGFHQCLILDDSMVTGEFYLVEKEGLHRGRLI